MPQSPTSKDGQFKGDMLDARLDEARLNSRSLAALASPRPPVNPAPSTPSRVMAMREQVEARERRAKEEAVEELRMKSEFRQTLAVANCQVAQDPQRRLECLRQVMRPHQSVFQSLR